MENDYYVYEHIRLDNNTCFYVGKGRGKRAYSKSRNEHHDRIVNKCGMRVEIIAKDLSEDEAFKLEKERISYYINDLGYGIDIIGMRNNSSNYLTNCSTGGEGSSGMVHSEEWKHQHSQDMMGENNPMYGVNLWETYDDNTKHELKAKLSKAFSGNKNPMYGISPRERMSDEVYENWMKTNKERLKKQTGSNNPNYKNKTLHNKVKDNPELRLQYYSRPGAQNGRARGIIIYDINHNYLNEFDTIGDGCIWIKDKLNLKTNIDGMRSNMSKAARLNRPYRNLYIEFK